jgi:solute:Na+ symporter, SSS family
MKGVVFMNGYLLSIIIYAIVLVLAGFIVSKHVKGASDFFVAGRKLNTGLLFTTIIAANIGAGSTVGITGIAYQSGISAAWWIFTSALGSIILAFIVGPKIYKLSVKYNMYTLGDYLDFRYDKRFRGILSAMMVIGTLALFAGQLMGVAWILNVTSGISKPIGVLIASVVITLYFAAGGLLSAAIVNILELVIILLGFIIAIPYAISFVGGFDGLHTMVANNFNDAAKTASYFSWSGVGKATIIGWFLMLTPSFFISPGLIGKVFGAKDEATVKKGTFYSAIVQFIFAFAPVLLGMCAFAVIPGLEQRELALPTAMKELMPFWASALALAAIFAAEVSTADAVLYMLSTAFTKDIYKTFISPDVSDVKLLKISRIVTVAGGILGIGMALLLPNIITALSIFYTLMSVSFTAPLLFGLFSKRPSLAAASVSAVIGVLVTVVLQFGNGGKGLWILNAQSTAILLTIVVMLFMMFAFPSKAFKQGSDKNNVTVN